MWALIKKAVAAIILYTWLLTNSGDNSAVAYLQNNLGIAYQSLPGGDREANLRQAIACYEAALQIFRLVHVDYYADVVDGNLDIAKDELQSLEQRESQDHEV